MYENSDMYLCPGCMRPLVGPYADCAVCGWRPGTQNPEPCLPVGTTLKGRYILGRGTDFRFSEEMDYLAWDSGENRPVEIREYFHVSGRRGPDGTMLAPAGTIPGWLSAFPAKFPNALDTFRENSTVYVVLGLQPKAVEPDSGDEFTAFLHGSPEVPFRWVMPDLDFRDAEEPSPQNGILPPDGPGRVVDIRRVCPACMYLSDVPIDCCPVCGAAAGEPSGEDEARSRRHGQELPARTLLGGRYLAGYALTPLSDPELFVRGSWRLLSCGDFYRRFGGAGGVPFLAEGFFENGTAYLATYIEDGLSLRRTAARRGTPYPVRELIPVLRQAAAAVKALHLQGGAHAGLSPETIFVTASGGARLLVPYGDTSPAPEPGTPTRLYGYKAPELAERQELILIFN